MDGRLKRSATKSGTACNHGMARLLEAQEQPIINVFKIPGSSRPIIDQHIGSARVEHPTEEEEVKGAKEKKKDHYAHRCFVWHP